MTVRGVETATCTRRLSQLVVRIAGVVEGRYIVGKYRSHGSVLPVSMMQRDHWIIRESSYASLSRESNCPAHTDG
jgi:hypothetical protein